MVVACWGMGASYRSSFRARNPRPKRKPPQPGQAAGGRGKWSLLASDAEVFDALLRHHLGFVHVAAVEDRRLLEAALDGLEIGAAEFLPLGDDHQRVGPLQGALGAAGIGEARLVAENPLGLLHGHRS